VSPKVTILPNASQGSQADLIPDFTPTAAFAGQADVNEVLILTNAHECLRFLIAGVQTTENQENCGSTFRQKRTF